MNYLFWILCALIVAIAMLFVVMPLWRNAARSNDVLRDQANLEILRDQLAEMGTDLRNGLLTQELFEQGKREIEMRLLKEVQASHQLTTQFSGSRKLAIILAVLLPLFSISLYLHLGNHHAATSEQIRDDGSGMISSEEGLYALAKQLRKKPENPNGWYMLANSYVGMQRYADAASAYEQLVELVPGEAQLWANYADIYGLANGKTLQSAKVAEFLSKALELDPKNLTALALSGSAGMQRGDYAVAIIYWQKLLSLMRPGSREAQQFSASLQRARELLAEQPDGKDRLAQLEAQQAAEAEAAANPAAAITGKVSLSPMLAGKVAPTDTVFVLARAVEGPKMPLAVFRKQVKDLPLQFTLDDSMAMQPQLKLSGFDQVIVVARVSKSGSPMSQSGDLQGASGTVKPGSKGLKIMIDSVVP